MDQVGNTLKTFFQNCARGIKEFWLWLRGGCHDLKVGFMTKLTRWIDPKLTKYRTHTSNHRIQDTEDHADTSTNHTLTPENHTPAKNTQITEVDSDAKNHTPSDSEYTPSSIEDFLALLKRTPRAVLNTRERHVIATIMNFPHVKVSEIMLPQTAITYVRDDEVLGPLTLDRLYRSGYQHFPVLNYDRKIIGVIHTTALNNLEIKETSRAIEILDPKVYYLREDYTLNQALAAFIRTNCYFFLVIDHYERIVGMLTYEMLVDYLLGETPEDDFDRDSDRLAVAKRK